MIARSRPHPTATRWWTCVGNRFHKGMGAFNVLVMPPVTGLCFEAVFFHRLSPGRRQFYHAELVSGFSILHSVHSFDSRNRVILRGPACRMPWWCGYTERAERHEMHWVISFAPHFHEFSLWQNGFWILDLLFGDAPVGATLPSRETPRLIPTLITQQTKKLNVFWIAFNSK